MVDKAAEVLDKGAKAERKLGHHARSVELLSKAAAVYDRAGRPRDALSVRVSHKELYGELIKSIEALGHQPERIELLRFALKHCETKRSWDMCLQLAERLRRAGVPLDETVNKIAQTAAFSHKKSGDRAAMLRAVRLFSDAQSRVRFLEGAGELRAAAAVLLELKRPEEAVDLMLADRTPAEGAPEPSALSGRAPSLAAAMHAKMAGDTVGEAIAVVLGERSASGAERLAALVRVFESQVKDAPLLALFALSPSETTGLDATKALHLVETAVGLCRDLVSAATAAEKAERTGMLTNIADALLRKCEAFLRVRGTHQHARRDMPTWFWLCEAAGHDRKQLLRVRSGDFLEVLKKALIRTALSWLRGEEAVTGSPSYVAPRPRFASVREKLVKDSAGQSTCATALSGHYCQILVQELRLVELGGKLLPDKEASGWSEGCITRILRTLYPELRDRGGRGYALSKPVVSVSELPYNCHFAAQRQLKSRIQEAYWRQFSEYILFSTRALRRLPHTTFLITYGRYAHRWWRDHIGKTPDSRLWNLEVDALLHKMITELLSRGTDPVKLLRDKLHGLRVAVEQQHGRRWGGMVPERPAVNGRDHYLPGWLLFNARHYEEHDAPLTALGNCTRFLVEYLHLNVDRMGKGAGVTDHDRVVSARAESGPICTPALDMCANLTLM